MVFGNCVLHIFKGGAGQPELWYVLAIAFAMAFIASP